MWKPEIRLFRTLLLTVAALCVASAVRAQATSVIQGHVSDQSGANIVSASIQTIVVVPLKPITHRQIGHAMNRLPTTSNSTRFGICRLCVDTAAS